MGSYDSPGFVSPLPGGSPAIFGQPTGSIPVPETEPATQQTVTVNAVYGGPRSEQVDAGDTAVPAQQALYDGRELISGVDLSGGTGAGQGHVRGPGHPNSGNPGGAP